VGGEKPERIAYKQMNFTLPILPVPGNHDYYDLPFLYGHGTDHAAAPPPAPVQIGSDTGTVRIKAGHMRGRSTTSGGRS